jgi:hypothetical protein
MNYLIKKTNEWTDEELASTCLSGPINPLRTFDQNFMMIVRNTFPVHIEVHMTLATVIPESVLSTEDLETLQITFVRSIRVMSKPVSVINRYNFRVWLAVPFSQNYSCPLGWVHDDSMHPNYTASGTELSESHVFYRLDLQFNEDWSLKPTKTPAFVVNTRQSEKPAAESQPTFTGFQVPQNTSQQPSSFSNTSQQPSSFGNTTQQSATNGNTTQQPSAFSNTTKPTSFGNTTQQPSSFGNTTQPTSFGNTQQPATFGNTQQPSSFGSTFQANSNFGFKPTATVQRTSNSSFSQFSKNTWNK